MNQEKHTPGPWKQHPDYPWIIKEDNAPISEDGVSICNTTGHPDSGFFPTPSEARANARLISAAPELLAALQDLKRELILSNVDPDYIESHFRKSINNAEAAISKAIGDRLGEMAAIDRIAKSTGA